MNFVLLSLNQSLSAALGLAYAVAEGTVAHGGGIEDDGFEFRKVNLAVGEDALVGTLVDNLADEHAVLETHHATLQRQRVLVDDGGIYVGAGRDVVPSS